MWPCEAFQTSGSLAWQTDPDHASAESMLSEGLAGWAAGDVKN